MILNVNRKSLNSFITSAMAVVERDLNHHSGERSWIIYHPSEEKA